MDLSAIPFSGQSLRSTAEIRTGSWRTVEPFFQDRMGPCAARCLAGEDIPVQVQLVFEKRYREALDVLRRANPFPAITGRVCPAPCESSCLRHPHGGSVSVRAIERFLGDWALQEQAEILPLGRLLTRIAVVGSGPAGLSAAYFLAREGHRVDVFEEKPEAGGLLRYGIPPFRLPRAILDEEIDLVFRRLPVEFHFCRRIAADDRAFLRGFDAVLLAPGRNAPADPRVPGLTVENAGLHLLERIGRGERPAVSGKVAVLGGGSTTLDCARSLLRLGAEPTVYYRRHRDQMPAFAHDLREAEEEGIPILGQIQAVRYQAGALTLVRTSPAPRSQPVETLPGTEFSVRVDQVLFATGEAPEILFPELQERSAAIAADADGRTSHERFFAAGDITADPPGTVAGAIHQGRRAAASIHARLTKSAGESWMHLAQHRGASAEPVTAGEIRMEYFAERRRRPTPVRSATLRIRDFAEVESGVDEGAASSEAARCLSCGTCVLCFNCRTYCADGAVHFDAGTSRLRIDMEHCKGCLVCVQECPRGCMGSRYVASGTADRE